MQYPDAYSNILRTLNPKVRSTLDNHYGINLKPETQTELCVNNRCSGISDSLRSFSDENSQFDRW